MSHPIQSDIRSAIQIAAVFRRNNQYHHLKCHRWLLPAAVISYRTSPNCCFTVNSALKLRAFSTNDGGDTTFHKVSNKQSLCTADELHYVSVNNSDWKLSLWRYIPPPQVQFLYLGFFFFLFFHPVSGAGVGSPLIRIALQVHSIPGKKNSLYQKK